MGVNIAAAAALQVYSWKLPLLFNLCLCQLCRCRSFGGTAVAAEASTHVVLVLPPLTCNNFFCNLPAGAGTRSWEIRSNID